MNVERQRVLKIPAHQGSVCLFVPIILYIKWKNDHKQHDNCHRNLKFGFQGYFCIQIPFLESELFFTSQLMSYLRCLILCCRRRVIRQRYQLIGFKFGIGTIYYPEQPLICISTWQYSLRSFTVLLIMDRPMYTMLHREKTCDYIKDGKKCMNFIGR